MTDSVVHDGDENKIYSLMETVSKNYDLPHNQTTQGYNERLIPFSDTELETLPKERIKAEIDQQLKSCGFPDVYIRHWFTRDYETLNKNLYLM